MASDSSIVGQAEATGAIDSFAEARRKLFAAWPLKNRTLEQAADALGDGDTNLAKQLVSKFLEKRPADSRALNLMGDIARRSGRFEEAEQFLSRCVEQSPDCTGYRFNYAVILRRLRKFEEALFQIDQLLGDDLRNPLFRDQKASVLRLTGRLAEALVYRRELSEEYPPSPEGWLEYGDLLRSAGLQAQCIGTYRKALELDPSLTSAYTRLAELKTYRFTAVEVERMEAQLTSPALAGDDRLNVCFALGKAYGDKKLYAKSFDNFAKGNALQRFGVAYDPERLAAFRSSCQSLFTKEFFRDRQGWGCSSDAPVFIVGLPRSGSTLIEQILSSHSAVEGLEELTTLDTIVGRRFSSVEGGQPHEFWVGGWFEFKNRLAQAFPRVLSGMDADGFRSLGEEYIELTRHRRKQGRPFFSDKELRNFGYVGLIHLILPNAKIIDVRRHPLDCGWSCFKTYFPGGQPFSHRLSDIGRLYADYVGLMTHFDRVLPGTIHRVIYEHLVADPETEVRRLLNYLRLPFEEQCLQFHENQRPVNTLSSEQVRTPLYQSGVAQWRPYEEWLGPLKAALGTVLEEYPSASDSM